MAAQLPIPVYTNLTDLYHDLGTATKHAERWSHLAEEFEKRYGRKPAYIARAPGRVNLIGEHIDYALFGVFPAAVERDILIACAPRTATASPEAEEPTSPGAVTAQNLHPKYAPQTFVPVKKPTSMFKRSESDDQPPENAVHAEQWVLDIDKNELRWESYVKAGYYGVLNHYYSGSAEDGPMPVDLLFTGSVPAGSGLSSSAAMVVASTLAFLAINGKLEDPSTALSKGALVEMAMENEKRVGVNSGGMDQAASVISTAGSALYVSFFPKLSAEPTPLPGSHLAASSSSTATTAQPQIITQVGSLEQGNSKATLVTEAPSTPQTTGAVFVCANSLVVSDKVVSSKFRYNLRVVETLVAARALGRILGVPLDKTGVREKITLREVLGRWLGVEETKGGDAEIDVQTLKEGLKKISAECERLKPTTSPLSGTVPGGTESFADDSAQLGVTLDEMIALSGLSPAEFQETYLSWVDVEATHFQLYKRAKHVFDEAWRVLEFRDVCRQSSGQSLEATLTKMGELMNESQSSCAELFECSCSELDQLTAIAREAGAYGSRLTGAGWGGCTVSLVPESEVDSFIAKVKAAYPPYKGLEGEALHEVIFATKPSSGACVYKFTE
ncbi:Galactokinase [Punctularia strigosozonata HHB-11173 SS5]|uniref:Galactokinase n=1 Tax=Punctularia strigosozonata (strain HHB-11173) TaxID=741275 RepID=UPI0004417233|nr:Galactokinase [Punctularia strigosozonata HHB-11173 SS5]EIN10114.1 Galactokinase [Punctularia strigosozonata HHB-11173 SS5]